MRLSIQELEAEVLGLTPADRARLLERLIDSFEPISDVQNAWVEEALRRENEVLSGASDLAPGAEAVTRIRNQIR